MGCKFSVPVATPNDFEYVHQPLPQTTLDTKIRPASKPGSIYHLKMRRKLWSWTGNSFGVLNADGSPFEANVKGKMFTIRHRMTLQSASTGRPIAYLLKMYGRFERTFKIYGFHPMVSGQQPSSHQRADDGRPLYSWGEIVDKAFSVTYTMKMADGSVYVADRVGAIMGKLQFKISKNGQTCASVGHENYFNGIQGPIFDIQVGPGIDPSLILCFTAVIDEIIHIREEERRKRKKKQHS